MNLDVITAGEPMVLFAAQQSGPLHAVSSFVSATAGAELNVAIGLARLGLRVGYLSRLGADCFGDAVAAVLDRERIDRSHVAIDPDRHTGFMLKSRCDDGSDARTEYFRSHSAASCWGAGDLDQSYCAAARHFHPTGIYVGVAGSTREAVFALATEARRSGKSISFDPNLRPALWRSQAEMLECLNRLSLLSDWVFPGLAEGQLLTGRDDPQGIADFCLERGASCVVVKLGAEGAYFACQTERGQLPGVPVPRVVDTVGAGDEFAVGLISGLLEGRSLEFAATHANVIGARVVQFPGDSDGLPTRKELDAMLGGSKH